MLSALLILAAVTLLGGGGIIMARTEIQRANDYRRRHYLVIPPRGLEFDSILSFVRGLGGLSVSPLKRVFEGLPTIVFETEADHTGIRYHLAVPNHLARDVVSLLRSQIPSASITPEKRFKESWDTALELRLTNLRKPLRIGSPEAVANTLLSGFDSLDPEEAVLMQWVIAPAQSEAAEDKEHQQKVSDHTFLAIGRLAARAETPKEAARLVNRLFMRLASLKAYGVTFRSRRVLPSTVFRRLDRQASVLVFPCVLNATELATVIAFPVGTPNIAGLPQSRARHLPPDSRIPQEGIILASSTFSGRERTLAIKPEDLTKHMHILGSTGTGKSASIEYQVVQEMQMGYGVTVIDPHGDSIINLLNRVPKDRVDDVILLDLTDSSRPVGLNFLTGDPYLVTNQVLAVFDKLYDIYRMPQTADILRSTVLTLAQKGMTLLDIPAVLAATDAGQRLRDRLIKDINDPALKAFWRQYNSLKPERKNEVIAPVLRRLRPFETWPSLRGCLGQTKSGFDLDEVLAQDKILLVNLSKGRVGEEEAKLFGSLFVGKFWNAVQRRASIPADQRKPYFFYIDEFQNYINLQVSFADVLTESRKYGLGFVVAHQHMGQLPFELREAVMPNARSKMVFQTSASDASSLAREMPQLKPDDFQNLGQYEVIARLTVDDQVLPPATGHTFAPHPPTGLEGVVRASSGTRYGKPLAEVEAELRERQSVPETPREAVFGREEDQ